MIAKPSIRLRFQSSYEIAPYTKQFTFITDHPVPFLPGQFMTLHIPHNTPEGNKLVRRSYSLANAPDVTGRIFEIAIAYVPGGVASEFFFNQMQPHEEIEATGPFGRLILQETIKNYLFIATGTGVAPYRAMLPQLDVLMQQNEALKITLLFGVRNVSDVLYRNEFLALAHKYRKFDFQVYYSQETICHLPYEYIGRVTKGLTTQNIQPSKNTIAYVCGNPNMVDDVYALLINQLHFEKSNIRIEKYTRTKVPTFAETNKNQ